MLFSLLEDGILQQHDSVGTAGRDNKTTQGHAKSPRRKRGAMRQGPAKNEKEAVRGPRREDGAEGVPARDLLLRRREFL